MVTVTELNRAPDGRFESLKATDELGNPTYATLGDVPTNLPKGTQVYVEDESAIYVEDGT